jgi:TonB-dependent SusC/RagA subfamily outer membrane receptor
MAYVSTLRFVGVGATLLVTAWSAGACAAPRPGSGTSHDGRPSEVSIGYGSQDRAEVTGAIATVRAEDLGREVTSFEDLVQGLAGVTVRHLPSGGVSLRIRGSSSLSSDAEPLYVINGVPMRAGPGQALLGVNPRDITRIDVLKDAGATSIYGSRGANGVVLIFTTPRSRRSSF